jgi:hypothetical protein
MEEVSSMGTHVTSVLDDHSRAPEAADNRPTAPPARSEGRLGTALRLSAVIAILMVVASASGLLVGGMYPDGAWAREALRGGDLTTLAVAAPLLALSLILAARGSPAAQAVWLGMLAYAVYNYAYYAFGAAFNDIFVLHIALLALSIWTLVLAVASVDLRSIAERFRQARGTRLIGGFLVVVGSILGGLWVFLALRYAVTGELMADIPREGIHLVFAVDTALLVPALVLSGVALWRRSEIGLVFGPAMTVMGAVYQVNLLVSGLFQANADVAGAKAFPLEGIVLAAGFGAAAVVLLVPRRGRIGSDPR